MTNRMIIGIMLIALGLTAGCGAAAKVIAKKSLSERTDVFIELADTEARSADVADVTIIADIKTHLEDYCTAGSAEAVHGKGTYSFLINIDGQAVVWNVPGKMHELPTHIDGKASRDPEAGEGMKYVLEKKVRLAAGTHEVFIGLPADHYYTVTDISVQNGKAYVLKFNPIYRHKTSPEGRCSFTKGILKYDAMLSERVIH